MAKLISSAMILKGKSHIPSVYTQLVLSIFGAIPCSFHQPDMPSLKLRESTFLYCVLVFGLTLWSSIALIMYMVRCMESAHPYNHFRYITAFQLTVSQVLHAVTIVSWMDTSALLATVDAWYQFIDKYETVVKKPIPNYKNRELCLLILIIVSIPVTWFMGTKLLESEIPSDLKYMPSIVCPGVIQVTFVLHWLGHYWTINKTSKELKKHLSEVASQRYLLTPKLLADYRALWILLRNIIDNISKMRIPLFVSLLQSIMATMNIFESILMYLKTRSMLLAAFNLGVSAYNVISMVLSAFAGHNATNQVQYLFEDLMTNLELSCVSKTAQRELCMIYLIKRSRKTVITLCGFSEINLPLLVSATFTVTMYILILLQFDQMR